MGAVAAIVYGSQLVHYAIWRSSVAGILITLAVPVWPYAVSFAAVRRRVTTDWGKPWVFCFVLVVVTITSSLWYLSGSSRRYGLVGSISVTVCQFIAFGYFGQWTFEDSCDEL
jgi:hypothetical protein